MNDSLVAFLKACVGEDERVALAASPGPWKPNAEHDEVLACDDITVADGFALSNNQLRATVDHIARHDPVRVLAEVAAKRRIIDLHAELDPPLDPDDEDWPRVCRRCEDRSRHDAMRWPCTTLRLLASVYAGRPGWRSEWAPDEEASRG